MTVANVEHFPVNPEGDSRVNSKISEVFNQSLDRDGFSVQITSLSQTGNITEPKEVSEKFKKLLISKIYRGA